MPPRTLILGGALLACASPIAHAREMRIPAPQGARRLIFNDDGHNGFYSGALDGAEALRRRPARVAGSNVWIYQWCVTVGTRVNYPSRVELLPGEGVPDDISSRARAGDREMARLLLDLRDRRIDTLQEIARGCHDSGLLCYASFRMNPVYAPVYPGWPDGVIAGFYNSRFWWDHPELRQRRRDGAGSYRFSYVHPAVRDRMLQLLREVLQRDVDGIDLDFLRHPPMADHESEALAAFREATGREPMTPETDDAQWLRFRAGYVTAFLREARAAVDAAAAARGRPIGISARVDQTRHLAHGCDVDTWAREGLIDLLIVAQHGLGGYELNLEPFVRLARGTGLLVFAGEEAAVGGRDPTPEDYARLKPGERLAPTHAAQTLDGYRERARRWYAQGARGLHLFNEGRREVFDALGAPR